MIPSRTKFNLRDKVVLVTGASRGLGLSLAVELGAEGATVAICARNEKALDTAARRIQRITGTEVLAVQCDLRSDGQVQSMVGEIIDYYGRIDALVNNAGTLVIGSAKALTIDDFEDSMATMFRAPLVLTWSVLPHMRRHGEGIVVNIGSIGGRISAPHMLAHYVGDLVKPRGHEACSSRRESSPSKIFCLPICPLASASLR